MGELILILGGARSGKSTYAEHLAHAHGGNVLFVATATADDDEMARRIAAHRAARPADWRTLEVSHSVAVAIGAVQPSPAIIILDCLTLLVANLLLAQASAGEAVVEQAVQREIDALLAAIATSGAIWIVVSNEVGMGVVPPYPLGRQYRDLLGKVNARVAAAATRAYLMIAGLPIDLKKLQE